MSHSNKIDYEYFLDMAIHYLIARNDPLESKKELQKEINFWNSKSKELSKPDFSFDQIVNQVINEEEFIDLADSIDFGKIMYHSKLAATQFLNVEKRNIPKTRSFLTQKHQF
jgi:hypothetical protein